MFTIPTMVGLHITSGKMDILGAYTLLSYDPADAYLYGMELSDDLLSIWMELHSSRQIRRHICQDYNLWFLSANVQAAAMHITVSRWIPCWCEELVEELTR